MAEYIEREKLLAKIDEAFFETDPDGKEQIGVLKCRAIIREIPAVDIDRPTKSQFKRMAAQMDYAPVVHGQWRQTSKGAVYCSNCGTVCGIGAHIDEVTEDLNFCSSCGARMDGEAK